MGATIQCPYCGTIQTKSNGSQSRCNNVNCQAVLVVNSKGELTHTYPMKIK